MLTVRSSPHVRPARQTQASGRAGLLDAARSGLDRAGQHLPAWIATLTALVGLFDIVTGISDDTPRWPWLGALVPGVVAQAATATTVGAGLLLIWLAHGLKRRKRRAWRAAVALLSAAVMLDLMRGRHIAEAVTALAPLLVLIVARDHFRAAGDPRTRWRALGVFAVLLAADLVIGLTLVRIRHGSGGLGMQAEHVLEGLVGITGPTRFGPGDNDVVVAVLLVLGAVTFGVTGYLLLRPAEPVAVLSEADEARLRALLTRHGGRDSLGYFALRRDKSVLWSASGKAAISYRVVSGVALASGDPLGDPEAWPGAINPFLDLAAAHAWVPAVLGCSEAGGIAYRRAGLQVLEFGDEAVVTTAAFTLEGRAMRGVRQAVARIERAGYTTRVDRVGELSVEERRLLAARAAAWRGSDTERGFSMALGRFGEPQDPACVVVRAFQDGEMRGFLHFAPWGDDGLSLDSMRRDRSADNGLNEFLIAMLLRAAPGLGIARVSLNFAFFRHALAHGERLGAGPVLRLWRRVLMSASRWFQIESIYRFNAKFHPEWMPRYFCYPNTRDLPRISLAALEAEALLTWPRVRRSRPRGPADEATASSSSPPMAAITNDQ